MSSLGISSIHIDPMDASTFQSPEQQLQSSKAKDAVQIADTEVVLIEEQLSFPSHLLQQDHMMGSPSYVCEWIPTNLRLRSDSEDTRREHVYLCLPTHVTETSYFKQNEEKEEFKDDGFCTDTATQLRLMELDRYLADVAPLASSTEKLLFSDTPQKKKRSNLQVLCASLKGMQNKGLPKRRSKYERQSKLLAKQPRSTHHQLITATNSGRVINVLQGEIAHCTPSQADVLVSDDATTCHIVGLWSRYIGPEGGQKMNATSNDGSVLATMTHIDGPGYETSIRDAVNEHVKYHSSHLKKENATKECKGNCKYLQTFGTGVIEMSIHIMGGFSDPDDSSIEITSDVLQTFAALANEFSQYSTSRTGLPNILMTLETCAVTSANDDGTGCPLGRGLGMEVATGKIFLAEIEEGGSIHGAVSNGCRVSAEGPSVTLRSARLWASAFHSHARKKGNLLNVIHEPDCDHLCVDPFFFGPHPGAIGLLQCGDEELLQLTSTSPDVEKPNFVRNVRDSLTFMNSTRSSRVFKHNQPMKFHRVGLNGWVRTS